MSETKLHDQPLIFNDEQKQRIDRCLLRLADHTGSPLVMVADVSGRLVLYRGRLSVAQSTGLGALAAGGFAAGLEIGHFLGLRDHNRFQRQLLEGDLASIYLMTVGEELLLIIAFTQKTTLGMVRIFGEQAQTELLTLAGEAAVAREQAIAEAAANRPEDGFTDEVSRQLDELFDGGF